MAPRMMPQACGHLSWRCDANVCRIYAPTMERCYSERSPEVARAGAEFFTTPAEPAQRRYEALRAYLLDGEPADVVGARFRYSPATMYQMAADLRAGKTAFFISSKPGPRGPRQTFTLRDGQQERTSSAPMPVSSCSSLAWSSSASPM